MSQPKNQDIPTASNRSLLIAVTTAVVIAVLVYFMVILPAEYNVDPTGVGQRLGLTVLSEPVVPITENSSQDSGHDFREDTVFVTVPANQGIEYKFDLKAYGNLIYDWKTARGTDIYFDFHGEPAGDTTGYFESYSIATTDQMKGSATMPFAGSHGWYWKNSTNQDIIIELTTSGNYQVLGLK